MALHFELDLSLCSACGACAVACMDQNDIDIEAGERPFRQVFRSEKATDEECPLSFYSVACMHCKDALCITACPSNCFYKDAETGFTLYDNTYCIHCHSCAMACPFGAPSFAKTGEMQKCDGCIERVRAGLSPACVKVCPTGALTLHDDGENVAAKTPLSGIAQQILEDYK